MGFPVNRMGGPSYQFMTALSLAEPFFMEAFSKMTVRPKRTKYNDILFRSRLEARWAVFMDLMGVRYKYEPFGAVVQTGVVEVGYLPDFELPDIDLYVEIKANATSEFVTDLAKIKAAAWTREVGEVVFLCGFPSRGGRKMYTPQHTELPYLSGETYNWEECPRCCDVQITNGCLPLCGCYTSEEDEAMFEGKIPDVDFKKTPRLMKAYRIAGQYNFTNNSQRVNMLPCQPLLI
ncbi:MAG: hypothetical protein V3571_00410 [Pseudodesulfovibrio sp.]